MMTLIGSICCLAATIAASESGELAVTWDSGLRQTFPVSALPDRKFGPDAILRFGKGRSPLAELHVRPSMAPFIGKKGRLSARGEELVKNWTNLPPASTYRPVVEFREATNGWTQLWIDGSYVRTLSTPKGAVRAVDATHKAAPFDGRLDFAAARQDGVVAKCKCAVGKYGLTVDAYTRRTPLGRYPDAIHFRLPAAPYARAVIDFTLDSDPTHVPYLTVRLARYDDMSHGIGCTKIEDATLDLRKGMPKNVRRTASGYRAEVELPIGRCVDYLTGDFIDLEFLGPLGENEQQVDNSKKPNARLLSSFVLRGVRLEKMDVRTEIVLSAPGNVFTEDEAVKRTGVRLVALADGAKGALEFGSVRHEYAFAKAGESREFEFDFSREGVGLYELPITVSTADGLVLRHPARVCVTPDAGRATPKYESPFGTWCFNRHGCTGDPEVCGPLFQKAGIRKVCLRFPKEACERYDFTWSGHVKPLAFGKFDVTNGVFFCGEDGFVADLRKKIAQNDWTDHVMVWHESAPGDGIPPEVRGGVAPTNGYEKGRGYAAYVNEIGRIVRKHFPGLRLKIGNSSASLGAISIPARGGVNLDYYDSVGMEIPSQTIAPERFIECGFLGMNLAKLVARKVAGRDLRIDGSFEFVYRTARDLGYRGEDVQAEWQSRDVLISLMNGFSLIAPQQLMDCTTAYCNTLWGVNGLCSRVPYNYPHKAYLAFAVQTKVFDGVTFVREVPTGSTTVYAEEFKRRDGKTVTAFWCARGDAEIAADLSGELVTLYGRRSAYDGTKGSSFKCGSAPAYVVSDTGAKGVRIVGRSFPDEARLKAVAKSLGAVSSADVTVSPDPNYRTGPKGMNELPILFPTEARVRDVRDPREGPVLEIVADVTNEVNILTAYTTVRFRKPPVIREPASVIGARVKGDSNWGRFRFKLRDASGRVLSNSSGGWGCDVIDWPGNTAVSFDGWGDVCQHTDVNDMGLPISPGRRGTQWGLKAGEKIAWPAEVLSVTIEMNRFRPTLLGFDDHVPTLCIKDLWYVPVQ